MKQEVTRTVDVPGLIEQFGGLRPMASKTGIPVTTIQGWKKRNAIPENRFVTLREAANQHGITLDPFFISIPLTAPPLSDPHSEAPSFRASRPNPSSRSAPQPPPVFAAPRPQSALPKFSWQTVLNIILLMVAVGAMSILLWVRPPAPSPEKSEEVKALESKIDALQSELTTIKNQRVQAPPPGLEDQPASSPAAESSLQNQVQAAAENLAQTVEKAKEYTSAMVASHADEMQQRLSTLENGLQSVVDTQALQGFWLRVQDLASSTAGQIQLRNTIAALNAYLPQTGSSNQNTEQMIDSARNQDTTLAQTFADIPPNELKAAALLMGMSEFRNALERDNQPFDQDLQLLRTLVGNEDPDLQDALTRLAPQAQNGVLTPQGLSRALKAIAADTVVASVKGENLSLSDKITAQLGTVFQVEKNGESVLPAPAPTSDARKSLAQAQNLLSTGDIPGAIAIVKTIQGPASSLTTPWIDQAQATMLARDLGTFFGQAIALKARGGAPLTAKGSGFGGTDLIQDESSGINILKQN